MSRGNLFLLEKPAQTLKTNVLPTNKDILLAIQFEKICNNKTFRDAQNIIKEQVISIWRKASLPTVTDRQVAKQMKQMHDKYINIIGSDKARRKSATFKKKTALLSVSLLIIINTICRININCARNIFSVET